MCDIRQLNGQGPNAVIGKPDTEFRLDNQPLERFVQRSTLLLQRLKNIVAPADFKVHCRVNPIVDVDLVKCDSLNPRNVSTEKGGASLLRERFKGILRGPLKVEILFVSETVLAEARAVEQGTDAKLYALGGEYTKLKDIQFSDGEEKE